MNTQLFIEKAKEIHGDKYDYSKVEYINAKTKVIIICKEHGDYLQQSNLHLKGSGCVKCFRDKNPLLQKSNITDFIEKAKKIHGDTYDYSKVEYIKSNEKVIIICKEHGEFLQTPNKHLQGGCKICGFSKQTKKRTKSKEKFIIEAIEIHGDKYDYSKVDYINNMYKVIIICKKHGEFLQVAGSHLQGHGCKTCSTIIIANKQRGSTAEFIENAKEIHGDNYDYSKTEYINCKEKVIITCKEHGEFQQSPFNHLQGNGCNKCGIITTHSKLKLSTETFITKSIEIHGGKYDYSKVNYGNNGRIPVIIICKIHGDFLQKPQDNLAGGGCRKCSNVYSPDTDEFIEKILKIHGNKYDYSKVKYTKAKNKIIIICKIHGDFEQEAYCHSIGVGCPICVNKTEAKLYEQIIKIYPSLLTQFKQDWCKKKNNLPYDFCISEHKIIIELDGPQHFQQIMNWSSPEEQFENDKYKEECANENGYSIIRLLQEDVFNDTYDWVTELCNAIEEIKTTEGITNIFLCKNDEYKYF